MLARDLGMTVARVRRSVSGPELAGWRALYELEEHDREQAARAAKRRRRR